MTLAGDMRTACVDSLSAGAAVAALLASARFDLSTEALIQRDMERLFAQELGLVGAFGREVALGGAGRIDFLLAGGVGVEVKHRRAKAPATRAQLERYAAHERVTALVLATAWPMAMPGEMNGKPVFVVSLGRAWL